MNIGVDLRCLLSPHRTGVGEYTFELLTALLALDHSNHYYFFYNSFSSLERYLPKFVGENVHWSGTHFPNKLFSVAQKLGRFPKLDHLIERRHALPPLDYFFSPHLNFTAVSPRTKHLLTIHDLTFDFFPNFLTSRQRVWHHLVSPRRQCETAHRIFTPSENTKRDLVHYYKVPAEKITVLYGGLSTVFSASDPTRDINAKYNLPPEFILFLGTVEPRKNLNALLEAYSNALPTLPKDYHLVIAGAPGWKNQAIHDRVRNSPLRDKIHIVGYVEEQDKPALYRAASTFVYPSFYEGFGFPVLEALSVGVPVITSNRSSLTEITSDGAYLINPHRPSEIALGLNRILNSEPYRLNLVAKGFAAAQRFSWKKTAATFLASLQP